MADPIVTGRGLYVPEDSLSNADVAAVVDREQLARWIGQNEWCRKRRAAFDAVADPAARDRRVYAEYIEERIGIRTRRVVDRAAIVEGRPARGTMFASDLGARAAERALEAAGVRGADLDVVICGTSSPDRVYPATAIEIQHRLGADAAHAWDLMAACSSFVYGLDVARALVMAGTARQVLVVAAEYFTCDVDYRDPENAFFWGDGAVAAVVESADSGWARGGYAILDTLCRSRFSDNIRTGLGGTRPLVAGALTPDAATAARPGDPSYRPFFQNGPAVYREVVPLVVTVTRELLARNKCSPDDIRVFMFHQASRLILEGIARRLLGAPDDSRVALSLDRFGNTSSCGVGFCLAEEERMQPGELACLSAFGAGYTVGTALLRKL
jgi:beta-ketodecanoyl-[acyl-carrier-protein] synthase